MFDYYRPTKLNLKSFTGHFVLTKNEDIVPAGWEKVENNKWVLGVNQLPVVNIVNGTGQMIGWCIGHPVNHENPWESPIIIQTDGKKCLDIDAIDNLYEQTAGRFIIVLFGDCEDKLFLDSYGSLGAVYSKREQTVASTPTFFGKTHEWDQEIINTLNMPERDFYFPLGLTPKKGVRRILPNHYLDLTNWSVHRHWPKSPSELTAKNDAQECVESIISNVKGTIGIIGSKYPMQLPITAGKDSRMVLACAREYLNRTKFFTFANEKENIDTYMASRLSQQLNLDHKIIPFQKASEEERLQWLYITGHSVSGAILNMHKSLNELDPNRVYLTGLSAEIGRMKFWRPGDHEEIYLSADELISRCGYPRNDRFLSAMENWLSELSGFNALNILDLCHIEQRLGCWASPQHYGCSIPKFELAPFNQRSVFRETMRLPYEYRKQSKLAYDICNKLWPELLELPFNEFVGYKRYMHILLDSLNRNRKKMIYNIKRVVKHILK